MRTSLLCEVAQADRADQRAAVVMSLVQSAKLHKIDPWAYLRDVLARIHSHPASRIDDAAAAALAGLAERAAASPQPTASSRYRRGS